MTEPRSTRTTLRKDMAFAQIPEWVLFHPNLSPQSVRIYGILARYADRDGQSFPSRRTLAEHLNVRSLDTVDRALTELVNEHAVSIRGRVDNAGDRTSNEYTVHLAPPEGVAARIGLPPTNPAAPGSRTDRGTVAAQIVQEREPIEEEPPTPTTDLDAYVDLDDGQASEQAVDPNGYVCDIHGTDLKPNRRCCRTTPRLIDQDTRAAAAADKRGRDRDELAEQRRQRVESARAGDSSTVTAAKTQIRQALTTSRGR